MLCPCGKQKAFSVCCEPIINGNKVANSPEQLMRSRYSAYATNKSAYILQSYANSTRITQSIDEIDSWAQETQWIKLVIHKSSTFTTNLELNNLAPLPTVEFSAFYIHQQQLFEMRECSNFLFEDNQWRYVDGSVSSNEEIMKPKRNEMCFCGSLKKFKLCCAKRF